MEKTTCYDKIKLARKSGRPTALDYIHSIFSDFIELHGDRKTGDDTAVVSGIAFLDGKAVTVIGTEKGKTLDERIYRNFGSAKPEGYAKALRVIKQGEKFNRPAILFVDTQGADCKTTSEEKGIAYAIAQNIAYLSSANIPIITVFTGEGGSGGALGFAVSDKIFILSNAYYSVITPESCASILYGNPQKAPEVAEMLKPTAEHLFNQGIVDEIIEEPENFDENATKEFMQKLKNTLINELTVLQEKSVEELKKDRYEKFRKIGKIDGFCAEN